MNAGGSVRYSRENELCRGITLTSKRGMEAHVTVPKRVNVTATESVYHIDCRAKCEYDIIVETPCTIKYRWGYAREQVPVHNYGLWALQKFSKMKSPLKTYLDSNMVVYSQGNNNNAHRLFSLWRKLTDVQHELYRS